MTDPSNNVVTQLEISTSQIKFLMDMMMGCPLGFTKDHAYQNNVNDSELYDQLDKCLQSALLEAE